jgi:hypothetical protein
MAWALVSVRRSSHAEKIQPGNKTSSLALIARKPLMKRINNTTIFGIRAEPFLVVNFYTGRAGG